MNAVYLGDKPTKTGAVVNADEIPLLDSQDLSSGRKKVKKVTAANLKSSIGGVQSVVAGSGVSVDNTDPANPVVSASGSGGANIYHAILNFSSGTVNETILANTLNASFSFAASTTSELRASHATPLWNANKTTIQIVNRSSQGEPSLILFGPQPPNEWSIVQTNASLGISGQSGIEQADRAFVVSRTRLVKPEGSPVALQSRTDFSCVVIITEHP